MNNHHVAVRRLTSRVVLLVAALGFGGAVSTTALADTSAGTQPAHQALPDGQQDRGLIRFAAGSSSGAVHGAVARGNWQHWGARAQRGQTIEITVRASAGNATFELYTPSGSQMANDVTTFRGGLPASGIYAIDVGSTGGLANYTLDVRITGAPTAPPPPSANGHFRGRIQVAASAQAGSVSGTVVRGDWHEWSFKATGGQTAIVRVSAPADNSTFSLYAPNGDVVAAHTRSFRGRLAATGLYMVEVGSTRGTAAYTLDLAFDGSTPPPASAPAPAAPPSHFQGNIQFAAGASSGSVGGTVQRGNWHEWSFKAFGGQSATLTVSAAGGSATFSLYEPDGDVLAAHTTSFTGTLPATGFYMIEVGSAGSGGAAYRLNLHIT
jgi:hypothetical protein